MRTLKAPWRSAQYLDGEYDGALIKPSELLAQIQTRFGPRWHLWKDERGRLLLTEFDQRHVVRATLHSYPTEKIPEIVVHYPRGVTEDEKRQLHGLLSVCFSTRVKLLNRRRIAKCKQEKERWTPPPLRDLTPDNLWEGTIFQPQDLHKFFLAHNPGYALQVSDAGVYYVTRNKVPVALFEMYPLRRSLWKSYGEGTRIKFLEPRRLRREQGTVEMLRQAIAILMHNRGYDPRTQQPYNRPGTS